MGIKDLIGLKVNKRYKVEKFKVGGCDRCGCEVGYIVFKYRWNEELDLEYYIVFLCERCFLSL